MTWFLTEDALTYAGARQRLIDRFGVTVNVRALHTFWHRYLRNHNCAGQRA